MCGFGRLSQMGQTRLRTQKRSPRVHSHHQVVTLHRRLERAGKADRAGIVHQDVDAAKMADRLLHRRMYLLFKPDVDRQRQRFPARRFDRSGRRMDGSGQLRVGRLGLGGNHDVGSIASRAHCDRQPNAATGARDE